MSRRHHHFIITINIITSWRWLSACKDKSISFTVWQVYFWMTTARTREWVTAPFSIPALGICWMPEQRCCVLRKWWSQQRQQCFLFWWKHLLSSFAYKGGKEQQACCFMTCCLCFEIYLNAVCCSCVGSLLCFIPSCVHNRDQGDTDAYRVVVAVFSLLYLIKVQFHCSHEIVFSLFCFLSLLCYTRRCVHIGGQGDSGRRQRRQLTILPPTFPATSDHGLCYGCVVLCCFFVWLTILPPASPTTPHLLPDEKIMIKNWEQILDIQRLHQKFDERLVLCKYLGCSQRSIVYLVILHLICDTCSYHVYSNLYLQWGYNYHKIELA